MPDGAIRAQLDAPGVVTVSPRSTVVDVDVLARIHNTGEHDYVLGAASADDVHNWHVLDQNHKEVLRAPRGSGPRARKRSATHVHPHTTQVVASGHSHNVPRTLKLDARKLKPGQTYTIRYEFWGQIAEAQFIVVPGQARTAAVKRPKKTAGLTGKAGAKKKGKKSAR